jgi:glycosyltransferase involved in cell wall biosynthesis
MKVINVFEGHDNYGAQGHEWSWLGKSADSSIQWLSVCSGLGRLSRFPRLARYLTTWRAVWKAKNADLIVTHGERMAVWVGLFKRLLWINTPHLAWSFTEPQMEMLSGFRLGLFKAGLRDVDRFIVFSHNEARSYPKLFGHLPERYQMVPWCSEKPIFDETASPLVEGSYIAAMGGEGRDYQTLFDAVRDIPDIRLVVVTRPEKAVGLDIPANVAVFTRLDYAEAMNIAFHSQYMVMPLISSKVAAGHGTLIAQFLLEKASIVTEAEAMEGYCENGENALMVPAQNTQAMREAILKMRKQPELQAKLTKNALEFARTHCSEKSTVQYFHGYLREKGLLSEKQDGTVGQLCW